MEQVTPRALVVGGSGAIGSAIAASLTKRGYAVTATFHRQPATSAGDVTWVPFDATTGDTQHLHEAITDGVGPLEVVVYAAGMPSTKRPVADTPTAEYTRLLAVNALGLVSTWQAIAEHARQARARVIVISSDTTTSIGPGNAAYTASKAALEAIAISLAKEEAACGVRVNVIAPSLVESPMAQQILARKGIVNFGAYYATLPGGRALAVAEVEQAVVAMACDPGAWALASGMLWRLAADVPPTPGRPS